MPWSKMSGLVPALLAASTLCGEAAASPASAASPLTVLGDSYSIPVHDGTRDWPAQLRDRGAVGPVHDFAKSGAIAAAIGAKTFARQVRLWTAAGRPRGDTVVYLGYNDIDGRQSLAPPGGPPPPTRRPSPGPASTSSTAAGCRGRRPASRISGPTAGAAPLSTTG